MNEFMLKYGCNPNQKPSRIFMKDGSELPITVLNGRPGYINFLDAFNSWQLVKELKEATGIPAAASFKHVSPAGAALGLPLNAELKKACFVDTVEGLYESPLACAFARARGTDRLCSFGDWIALSDVCDVATAKLIQREVSDGVIAPGYEPEALEILKSKRKGGYNIVEIDPAYTPAPIETKDVYGITFEQGRNEFKIGAHLLEEVVTANKDMTDEALAILKTKRKGSYNVVKIDENYIPDAQERKQVYGITFEQGRNNFKIGAHLLENIVTANKDLPESAKIDLIVALITLKYTQSNSVCYAVDGQAIGVGAGQQSRIHCTRLAGGKADTWFLRQHPKTLGLKFRADLGRANRDNVIDGYINGNEEDVCADGIWQNYFTEQPERLTEGDKKAWLASRRNVALGSDAFFPFSDNIKRAAASGVKYIAEPGGSIRDDLVIEECNNRGIVMAFTGMRLFHH